MQVFRTKKIGYAFEDPWAPLSSNSCESSKCEILGRVQGVSNALWKQVAKLPIGKRSRLEGRMYSDGVAVFVNREIAIRCGKDDDSAGFRHAL